MTISSTYYRKHMAQIVDMVDSGKDLIVVFGKGKKSKKTVISPLKHDKEKTKEKSKTGNSLIDLINLPQFKNKKIGKEFQEAKDYKEIRDKYYNIEDFLLV